MAIEISLKKSNENNRKQTLPIYKELLYLNHIFCKFSNLLSFPDINL